MTIARCGMCMRFYFYVRQTQTFRGHRQSRPGSGPAGGALRSPSVEPTSDPLPEPPLRGSAGTPPPRSACRPRTTGQGASTMPTTGQPDIGVGPTSCGPTRGAAARLLLQAVSVQLFLPLPPPASSRTVLNFGGSSHPIRHKAAGCRRVSRRCATHTRPTCYLFRSGGLHHQNRVLWSHGGTRQGQKNELKRHACRGTF